MSKADIGLIGLGVMGANLARNMAGKGYRVAVFDRDPSRAASLSGVEGIVACPDEHTLLGAIRAPRPVLMLVPAGEAVEAVIAALRPHLSAGDILIDAGNSDFHDTRRRTQALEAGGLAFMGIGISGGAQGALEGPAIMAGGTRESWTRLAPILTDIAARHGDAPSAGWLGPDGAGHFVKTVHNGIEYADMQMIAEVFGVLRDGLGLEAAQIADVFAGWNDGPLASYLVEITARVAATCDPETGAPMLDLIDDRAGQKGTGRWSVIEAHRLGAVASTIEAAVGARNLSADTALRNGMAESALPTPRIGEPEGVIDALHGALLAGRVVAYAQGFDLLAKASEAYAWSLDLAQIARVWRAGCIIRSAMLDEMAEAFERAPHGNLMTLAPFAERLQAGVPDLRRVCGWSVGHALPAPALSGALSSLDQLSRIRGTTNMIQGLRDCFGQHGFSRLDRDGTGFHADWSGSR